uniref:G_PROTEIN_RECEP_F1_2 domain-containing protein n=1 Tax=Syphacia muris TaxID=451379 RepID=A0A0N5ACE1_9BILA
MTGGGLLTRWRFTRLERVCNVYLALSISLMTNLLIWLSLILSLICVPSTIIVPLIHSKIPTVHKAKERSQNYRPWSKRNRDGKLTFRHRLARFIKAFEAFLAILFIFITVHSGFKYFREEVLAFSRRTLITVVFWIFLIEPIKALICAAVVTRYFKDYTLIRTYEMEAIDCLKKQNKTMQNITDSVECKVSFYKESEDDHGQRLPFLHKSYETRERRMRDEQL